MDKVKVNNQVVKMRKHVKRAKLFAINKFTKQLKQLQNKKGSDSKAEKNQRKVERLLEKVKILKKMMPDFVSKKALSKAQDWNALLAQKNIPLDDQCLALLANDNEVQKEVDKFHAQECQLVEKIPTLLLEWEVKSRMPKSPDKKKKAADIKKQKLGKIAKRKKSNFKSATFPNNVAVDKSIKTPNHKKIMLSKSSNVEDVDVNANNQSQNSEPMEGDSDNNDQLNSESSNDSSDGESEEFFTKAEESKKRFVSKEQIINKQLNQSTENSPNSDNSSDEEESGDSSMDNIKTSISPKIEFTGDSATCSQPSIFERLNALANTETRRLKAKNKSKSNSQNTKAIKVLDLNELQDSEQILIQNSPIDSEEPTTSLTVVPKKDSFFLNGDEEVESSDDGDESYTNNYKNSQPKRKFSNFDRSARESKFKGNNFGDKPRKSFISFKDKNFNRNENRFQNKQGKDFNRSENRFQNKQGKDFNRSENRFQNKQGKDFNRSENRFQNKKEYFNRSENRVQKNMKGDLQFKNSKKFDNKSKESPQQFKHSNPVKMNDSSNHQRENRKSSVTNSFQTKKESNEKGENNVNLHPSWEAKNKLKEAAKSGFKGKRIVFD